MNFIRIAAKELFGLFVDDGSLALGILIWIGVAAALRWRAVVSPGLCGALMIAGLMALLVENVWRTSRRKRRASAPPG
jgi:hypothetical protein